MKKKTMFTQIRTKGWPTGLRFTDLDGTRYILHVSSAQNPPVLALGEENQPITMVLSQNMAAELARVLEQYHDAGTLVPKNRRPERERCPECGHKSVDPRADWDDEDFHHHGPKCTRKDCTYAQGLYSGPKQVNQKG